MKTMGKIYPEILLVIGLLFGSNANVLATTRYVDINNTTPSAPYISWATAANTIQPAIDMSGPGDHIWVADGTYVLSSEIVVNKPVTIQASNGPDAVTVDGGGANRCFNLGSSACVLSGFTISNGYAGGGDTRGGGVCCEDSTPVVRNCILTGNVAQVGAGMHQGAAYDSTFIQNDSYLYGGGKAYGLAINCSFIENQAITNVYLTTTGGGMHYGEAYNCIFIGNHSKYGGGTYSVNAYNCTLVSNSAEWHGGGMFGGFARNCISWYNSDGGDFYETSAYNTCSPDAMHGIDGNITNAPVFLDKDYGNYRLPCIDSGDNAQVSTATDLDGNPRIMNGTVDMGAYEGGNVPPNRLMVSVASFSESILLGGSPSNRFFEVWNSESSTLIYSISDNVPWLTCSPLNGSSAGEHDIITVGFDTSSMSVGSYTGQITIASADASNAPQYVEVVVNVCESVLEYFDWATIDSPQGMNVPIDVTISARNMNGDPIASFTGTLSLSGSTEKVPDEVGIGTGTLNSFYPITIYWHDQRTQVIYLNTEIGNSCSITSLMLNVMTAPSMPLDNWTIRMRHTPLDSYSESPVWETGWTVVHQSTATISASGWVEFGFDMPFEYNGVDNLMIDFSSNNDFWVDEESFCMATEMGSIRTVYYESDSEDGDPLDWAGSTPFPEPDYFVPNIKLGVLVGDPILISPTNTGVCVNGVWAGTVTVLETVTNMVLYAEDGNGHSGDSNPFDVISSGSDPDTDGDGMPDAWEVLYFGHPTSCVATDNPDGDAHNNLQERITGMDPTQSNSCFSITNFGSSTSGLVIEWPPISNRLYSVLWNSTLTNGFQTLETGIEFPQNSYTDALYGAEDTGYYKVDVQLK